MSIKKLEKSTSKKLPGQKEDYNSIQELQDKLFKSLNTVFDPSVKPISDEDLLSDDFERKTAFNVVEENNANPFKELAEKAKSYAKEMEAMMNDPIFQKEKEKKPKKKGVKFNQDADAFKLTTIGMEGNIRPKLLDLPDNPEAEAEQDVNIQDVVGNMEHMAKGFDDLEELRRMIRETKREMGTYGRELVSLKNSVSALNDYASQELGYSASSAHLMTIEHNLNELKDNKEFKFIKKATSTASLKTSTQLPPKPKSITTTSSTTDTSTRSLSSTGSSLKPIIPTGGKSFSGAGNQYKIRTGAYNKSYK